MGENAMDTRVETELVRFRVDGNLKTNAEAACNRRGLDLNDVLRTLVRRIAMEDAIPFDLNAPARIATDARTPFDRYGEFLDQDLAHLKIESVIGLLATFIADRARRMAAEKKKTKPNTKRIEQWLQEASEAMQYRRGALNSSNAAKVEKQFTALLAVAD